jgi:hypothetical protein
MCRNSIESALIQYCVWCAASNCQRRPTRPRTFECPWACWTVITDRGLAVCCGSAPLLHSQATFRTRWLSATGRGGRKPQEVTDMTRERRGTGEPMRRSVFVDGYVSGYVSDHPQGLLDTPETGHTHITERDTHQDTDKDTCTCTHRFIHLYIHQRIRWRRTVVQSATEATRPARPAARGLHTPLLASISRELHIDANQVPIEY